MPALQKYPTPTEQLIKLGRAARDRGLSFDEFWEEAVRPSAKKPITTRTPAENRPEGAIIWPHDSTDRRIALAACEKRVWRGAYEQVAPTRQESALLSLR